MRSMPSWKYILAGALAGLCLAIMAMLCIIFILYTGVFWQYLFNSQIPIIQDTAWLAVTQDMSRLPSFLWGWRWIVVATTLSGIILAFLEHLTKGLDTPWRRPVFQMIVFTSIGTIIITQLLIVQSEALRSISNAAERIATLAQNQPSIWQNLLLASVAGFALAGVLWMSWNWWYERWCGWLAPKKQGYIDAPELSSEQWFVQRKASSKVQRILLLLLPLSVLAIFGAATSYDLARPSILSGELWVDANTPQAHVPLTITTSSPSMFVENTFGTGSVEVAVFDSNNALQIEPVILTFHDNQVSYERTQLALANLKQASYVLQAQLKQGAGGRVGYALIQGNMQPTLIAALLLGLSTSFMLALMLALLSSRVQAGSRVQ